MFFAGENRGQFGTALTYFEVTCSGRVSSQLRYHTLLRHLLFTRLQISRVMVERMISIVSKHERIPEWMCFSEKVDQALVEVALLIRRQALPSKMTSLIQLKLVQNWHEDHR